MLLLGAALRGTILDFNLNPCPVMLSSHFPPSPFSVWYDGIMIAVLAMMEKVVDLSNWVQADSLGSGSGRSSNSLESSRGGCTTFNPDQDVGTARPG